MDARTTRRWLGQGARCPTATTLPLLLALLLGAAGQAATQAQAQPLAEGDRAAIVSVIERQLAAFRRDDGREAFSYASPEIQERFGTAERFMEMVRQAYLPVYRPERIQFLELETMSGTPVQRVFLVGPQQRNWMALYPMRRTQGGEWRIDGCVLVPSDGSST